MTPKRTVVFFDFDGTLTKKDSFIAFILYTDGPFKLFLCLFVNFPQIVLYLLDAYSNHRLKEKFFAFFYKNKLPAELEKKGHEFCEEAIGTILYPRALELVQWHRAQGHELYLLTASSGIWLHSWCIQNNLTLIGTEFETIAGKYTGKIVGENCHGKEKAKRVQAIISSSTVAESYGYGNEVSDQFFLTLLQHQVNEPLTDPAANRILGLYNGENLTNKL